MQIIILNLLLDPFSFVDEWISILLIAITFFCSYLIGFNRGTLFYKNKNTNSNDFFVISSLQAGIMSLLGIMLAFSFSVSSARFEERRALIDKESLSIGKAYFRVGLLNDSTASKNLRLLLKQYLKTRIEYYTEHQTGEQQEATKNKIINLQITIWAKSAKIGKKEPNAHTSITLQALNDIVDTSESITSALENRAPATIIYILILISILAFFANGYYHAFSSGKKIKFTISLIIIICSIILLIIDLDRPLSGIVNLDISSLELLYKTFEKYGQMTPTENYNQTHY